MRKIRYHLSLPMLLLVLNGNLVESKYELNHPVKLMTDQESIHTKIYIDPTKSWTKIYACPRPTNSRKPSDDSGTKDNECLIKMNKFVKCIKEFKAKLVLETDRCGREKQGYLYSFKYDLCFEKEKEKNPKISTSEPLHSRLYFGSTFNTNNHTNPNESDTPIEPEMTPLILYSACYDTINMETLYTTHIITINNPVDTSDPENYVTKLQTNLEKGSTNDLTELAQAYQKVSFLMEKKYESDFSTPQVLVPADDIDPSLLRDSHYHYLNIRPQWNSKRLLWKKINKTVVEIVRDPQANVYTATSEILRIDNEDQIFQWEAVTIRIPFMWWKLITIPSGQGFIIVLYNVPLQYPLETMKSRYLCDKSICGDINFEIEQTDFIQCCSATEEILGRLGYSDGKEITDVMKFEKYVSEEDE